MTRVLVTGAADGIGRAIAIAYRRRGAAVVGVDFDPERGASVEAEHGIAIIFADIADRAAVDTLVDRLAGEPAFDVVVHKAGIGCTGRFEDSDIDVQRRVLSVNLDAPLVLAAGLLRSARVVSGGAIAFISSLSHQVGYPGATVYAANDGLASYARSLSVALAPHHIQVTRVFPGPTRTAHAACYAPAGSDASKRMPAARVAEAVLRAIDKRRPICVPGFGNHVVARLGPKLPAVMDWMLRKAILDPLDRDALNQDALNHDVPHHDALECKSG